MDPALERLRDRAQQTIDDGSLPSCQFALAHEGRLVAFETFGDATNDTRYNVFSCSKGPVSSVVWMLLGSGDVALGDCVAGIVPGFGANGKDGITVEHLLRHTAGFPNGFINPHAWNDPEQRRTILASWGLEWEPGSRYVYHSLSATYVLCEIIDQVTGEDHRQVLSERVLEPIGMKTFGLGVPVSEQDGIAPLVVTGEAASPDELEAAIGVRELPGKLPESVLLWLGEPDIIAIGVPAGGGIGTAADLALFYQAVLHNTGDLWKPDVLAKATSVLQTIPDEIGRPTSRGLGLQINGDHGSPQYGFGKTCSPRAFGHDGAGSMIAWADPATGYSFGFVTNGLEENIVRQKRRMASLGTRAAACADAGL